MNTAVRARISSKGQITIPKAVRDALDLREGEMVEFKVGEGEAVMRRVVSFLEYFGAFKVPGQGPVDWKEVRRQAAEEMGENAASEGWPD